MMRLQDALSFDKHGLKYSKTWTLWGLVINTDQGVVLNSRDPKKCPEIIIIEIFGFSGNPHLVGISTVIIKGFSPYTVIIVFAFHIYNGGFHCND